jgi:4-hydroxy-3-methylbut-2-enyl diphosphate reductase
MSAALVAAPLRLEAALIRSGARGSEVRATGMGPKRARAAAHELAQAPGEGLLVLGFCGGLDPSSRPGEVIVAEEVWAAADEEGATDGDDLHGERVPCSGTAALLASIAGQGMRVRTGAIVSVSRLALGERRSQLHAAGAIAVDMESAWLAPGARGRPFAVVRVVLDSPTHELLRPRALVSALRASAVLRRVAAAALSGWPPALHGGWREG